MIYIGSDLKLDPAHETYDIFKGELTEDIWRDKYLYDRVGERFPHQGIDRVARSIASVEPDSVRGIIEDQFRFAMLKGLWVPAGRILAGAGTDKRVTLMNCLSGDTLHMTPHGLVPLKQCNPDDLLTRKGWISSEVRSFGIQELFDYTFKPVTPTGRGGQSQYRRTVRATRNHRWILASGQQTTKLELGHKVPSVAQDKIHDEHVYQEGFKHGLVFGDGTHARTTLREVSGGYPLGTMHFTLRLCGAKADYLPLFSNEIVGSPPACNGDPVVYLHTDKDLKALPVAVSGDYIHGFIDGWAAADGSDDISGKDSTSIFSKNIPALEWLADHAPYAGYAPVGLRRYSSGVTNYGGSGELWVCTLRKAEQVLWEVVSIKQGPTEEVFCAIVPEEHEFVLAGGILTGNCFVNGTIEDSMDSILLHHNYTMLTMQQGGGMGTDFSTIRPDGAIVSRTYSVSSGILPFMDGWDQWCKTIRSAGDRRGAMMGTLSDWHPDLPAFIVAKRTKGRLENFNVSILISDAFMAAVADNEDWPLYFNVPPKKRKEGMSDYDFVDDRGVMQYVYDIWHARDLWSLITHNTFEYSEPGVIFIDRINDMNNLYYCEDIRCTNPCGEQPLPPHATCNLGAVNLARMIRDPFTPYASFDFDLLCKIAKLGTRFLDNVIDVTNYPLEEQRLEQMSKRRIGLGITGLGDALAQLRIRYGSVASEGMAGKIQQTIAIAAYEESVELAKQRGAFPMFDAEKIGDAYFIKKLPRHVQEDIREHGLRNGVLLTNAPTGTTSIAFGNPSSGLEPNFGHHFHRKVRQHDGSFKQFEDFSYISKFHTHVTGEKELPEYVVTIEDLDIIDHIRIQGAMQNWVDASVSKTINVSKNIDYDDFAEVYKLAYHYGCKGCTTYRPSDVRGSILSAAGQGADSSTTGSGRSGAGKSGRPRVLSGHTYQIDWPSLSSSMYVTINYTDEGTPYEMFFASKDARYADWMTALTLMISALLRKGVDPTFIPGELKQVISMHDTAWIDGKHYGSLVSRLGALIEDDFKNHNIIKELDGAIVASNSVEGAPKPVVGSARDLCPRCSSPSLTRKEGCKTCESCGWSAC